jgi:hypothetical protein
MEGMKADIDDIKNKQKLETAERVDLAKHVDLLTDKLIALTAKVDQIEQPNEDNLIEKMMPKVSQKFSKEILTNHFQSLANDIRQTETGIMLFGYKPDGGSDDLMTEIKQKVLIEKMKLSLDIGNFRVEKIGRGGPGKNAPIKMTFSSFSLRNEILKSGNQLPKPLKIEKCLPPAYRNKNKELLHKGWQLKLAKRFTIKTRVILVGHLLVLQVKNVDDLDSKYDWVNQIEWFPPKSDPTAKPEPKKPRAGLTPTVLISEAELNYVIFSDLTTDSTDDKSKMIPYMMTTYLDDRHKAQVGETVNQTEENRILIKVASKVIANEWKDTYLNKPFNGKNPTIELINP